MSASGHSVRVPARRFNLHSYFAATSFVAVLLVALTLVYFEWMEGQFFQQVQQQQMDYFREMQQGFMQQQASAARRDLLAEHEAGHVNIGRLFSNTLWEKDFAPFVARVSAISVEHCRALADVAGPDQRAVPSPEKVDCFSRIGRRIMALPEFRRLDARVRDTMRKSTVFKIKVFDRRGITAYSSETRQVGEDRSSNAGWVSAVAGLPASQLTFREHFSSFEGEVENRDLISSYLPVYAPGSETIAGVFEVYSDVTSLIAKMQQTSADFKSLNAASLKRLQDMDEQNRTQVQGTTWRLLVTVFGLLVLLYVSLYLIVRNGQRIMDRQEIERQRADDRLRAAVEGGGICTWIWYMLDGRVDWDDAAVRLFGRTRDNFDDRVETVLSLIHPGDRERIAAAVAATQHQGRDLDVEFRLERSDGAVQWIAARGHAEFDAGGRPWRMTGACTDITQRKLAEEINVRTQKMEALGTLTGGIAHDFNNLLLAITGNLRLALRDIPPSHPARVSLLEVDKAGARAAALVRRILTFSREQPPEMRVQSIAPVVEDAVAMLRSALPGLAIETAFDTGLPAVACDDTQIHQIVMNLVTNAAHAIGERAGLIRVRLAAINVDDELLRTVPGLQAGRHVRLTVADNGCGMDAVTLARIFDPFFTTKPVGVGTGLGLSTVHGIVSRHGGAIAVTSLPGNGTTFDLYFPLPAVATVQPIAAVPAAAAAVAGVGQHILYVDDEEALVFLLRRMLDTLGYRVTACTDAREALRQFCEQPDSYDMVVSDLSMPGLTGFELARRLREIRADLPVQLLSGYVREVDRDMARAMGLDEILTKPNTVEELGLLLDHKFRTACRAAPGIALAS